eukprot:1568064-Prymnesium_polylepis.1
MAAPPTLHRAYWRRRANPKLIASPSSRLRLHSNTLERPAVSMSDSCPAVSKTFLNEATCVRQATCAATSYTSATLALD